MFWKGEATGEIRGYFDYVHSIAASPDGKTVLTASGALLEGYEVKVWDLTKGKQIKEFKGLSSTGGQVAISPDGRHAVSGGGNLKFWDLMTGHLIWTSEACSWPCSSIAFSNDGKTVLAGCGAEETDGGSGLFLWDAATGHKIWGEQENLGKWAAALSIAILPDGGTALIGLNGSNYQWQNFTI